MKRKPLTKTRNEAVNHFVTALKRYDGLCQNFDITKFLKDYRSGADLESGHYKLTGKQKVSQSLGEAGKKKTPWYMKLLGYD